MSNSVKMELKGLDKLLQGIEELGRKGSRIQNEALKLGAEPILEDAKTLAPVLTGAGVKGLTIGRPRTKGDKKYITVGIDKGDISEVFYMKFHEFGTTYHTELAFLATSYENNKDLAQKIIIDNIKRGLGLK